MVEIYLRGTCKLTVGDSFRSSNLAHFEHPDRPCLASTIFTHQRQLFLPINDNYNLDELPLD